MFEADLHRQVRRATHAGCGIAAVMLATAASAGEAGSAGCAAAHRPASGSTTRPANWMHSVEDAMAGWAEHLGCGGIETMAVTQNAERREYRGCGTTGALALYALRGSGHTWPGSSFAFPDYLGATEANIDATVLSLDWFERHRRAGNSGS